MFPIHEVCPEVRCKGILEEITPGLYSCDICHQEFVYISNTYINTDDLQVKGM